jgi:hypothetical protein
MSEGGEPLNMYPKKKKKTTTKKQQKQKKRRKKCTLKSILK